MKDPIEPYTRRDSLLDGLIPVQERGQSRADIAVAASLRASKRASVPAKIGKMRCKRLRHGHEVHTPNAGRMTSHPDRNAPEVKEFHSIREPFLWRGVGTDERSMPAICI